MRVTTTKRRRHQPIRFRAISDHHRVARRRITDRRAHQRRHWLVGFAGHNRLHARRRDDRCQNRASARDGAVRGRIRRIVIRTDQAGAVAHGATGPQHLLIVEGAMKAHHHGVDGAIAIMTVAATTHDQGTAADHCLHHTFATADQHSLTRFDQQRGCIRRREDVTHCRDPNCVKCRLLQLDARGRVVGDEENTVPSGAQLRHRDNGAGNRLVRQPHDPVEIAQHGARLCCVRSIWARSNRPLSVGYTWLSHIWPCWHARCQPVWVPRFEPFPALRYTAVSAGSEPLDDVVAPPYDVLSSADIDALLARDEHNIVAVDVPLERDGPTRYELAADRLGSWIREGVLQLDTSPSLTLYRMEFNDGAGRARRTVGVIGALEVVDEGADGVLPHERTTPKAKTDRLELTRATRCNLSPVWGLSLAEGLTDLLREPGESVGRCTDENGVVHRVERVVDPTRLAAISGAVGSSSVLIADGHHRYAISRSYRDEVRDATGRTDTGAELTMTYVAELVDDQLSIDPIHRVYRGLSADAFAAELAAYFIMTDAGRVTPGFAAEAIARGALCLVRPDGTGVWLTPRNEAFAGVRALDGVYLEHALAGIAGIDVSYQHGVQNVIDLLAAGDADAAVLIRPTSIEEIRRTAIERLLMPPKSTFFTPKLRTGLVIRPLDVPRPAE